MNRSNNIIHFIDGEKGGVGKTLVTMTLIHFLLEPYQTTEKAQGAPPPPDTEEFESPTVPSLQSNSQPFLIVDADKSNPDVKRAYGKEGCYSELFVEAYFSEDENSLNTADIIFDLAMEKTIVVNLPAASRQATSQWLDTNDLLTLATELPNNHQVQFVKWFVTDGSKDSLELFIQSVHKYGKEMTHVLVQNEGLCRNWDFLNQNAELQDILTDADYTILMLKFPKLFHVEARGMREKDLTFAEALDPNQRHFMTIPRQRIKNFLKQATLAFEETNLFQEFVHSAKDAA